MYGNADVACKDADVVCKDADVDTCGDVVCKDTDNTADNVKRVPTFTCNPTYLSRTAYTKLLEIISTQGYGHLDDFTRDAYHKDAADIGVTAEIANSVRSIALKHKIICKYPIINRKIRKLRAEYMRDDITVVAARYDFPPVSLLREIMKTYYKQATVKLAFSKRELSGFKPRDRDQYYLASKFDAESGFDSSVVAAKAQLAEDNFVACFSHCKIKSQADLVAEDMLKYGRAVNTPDILFIEPILVNDIAVHWIDYKDYVLTDMFILRSNLKQARRYVNEWGVGALVYRGAVLEDVASSGIMFLTRDCFQTSI
tara:strand:+ start:9715 stop:10653 length:939 start_codon:yes stop_codon:yes gene_type:complete